MGKTFTVKGWRVSRRVSEHRCVGCSNWNRAWCQEPVACLHAERVDAEVEAVDPGAALDELDARKPGRVWVSVTVEEVLSPARQMENSGATPLFDLTQYE